MFIVEYHIPTEAFPDSFINKEIITEKALPYFHVKKDFSSEGKNISYPKFEIIFSVAKDWITLFVCSSNFSCNIFNATSVLYIS